MNNRRRKTSLQIYVPLTFLPGFEKSCSKFACERELEVEHHCDILTPKLMAVSIVSFSFSRCWTGALGSTLLGAGFLYCIVSASSLGPNSSGPKWPLRPDLAFPTTSRLQLPATQLARRTQLSYIIVRRQLDLWNRMSNRHQAEIAVMQFTGHSLPVHQSMSVPWEFF